MPGSSERRATFARRQIAFVAACTGIWLAIFALVALSGPGRIDIVDGQTRYEVARSLVDHGDHAIRDPRIWFGRFPGRNGQDHTTYRFPQSVLAAGAILLSDWTGPESEPRRHFFFSLTGAAAAATLALAYLLHFTRSGLAPGLASLWAILGVVATPSWFYATSTFDDILGTTVLVWAFITASGGSGGTAARALGTGALVGLAVNCKQPLGIFILPVLGILLSQTDPGRRLGVAGAAVAGLVIGIGVLTGYDAYKFPPETRALHAALQTQYIPVWPGRPLMALLVLAFSPSAGVLWYAPAVLIGVLGLLKEDRNNRLPTILASAIFVLFIASMSIFKGDPAWGPRYLTPLFGLAWLWAPIGARLLRLRTTMLLLTAGVLVQVMALAVDPHRLYVERDLPSAFGAVAPVLYFDPANAHILQRPREVIEIWNGRRDRSPDFSPAPEPTFAFPVLDRIERGADQARRYTVLNAFRPWGMAFLDLQASERPIFIRGMMLVLFTMLGLGATLLAAYLFFFDVSTPDAKAQEEKSHPQSPVR